MKRQLLTSGQAAAYLGLYRKEFMRWAVYLPKVRAGRGWSYFLIKDLDKFEAYIKAGTQPPTEQPPQPTKPKAGKSYWDD